MMPLPGWEASDPEGSGISRQKKNGGGQKGEKAPPPRALCLPPELSPEPPSAAAAAAATRPGAEPPRLLAHGAGRDAVLGALDLEVKTVPPDGPGVVVEADAAPLPGHEALGHAVAHDPAADPARGRVDGRVLEAPRAV